MTTWERVLQHHNEIAWRKKKLARFNLKPDQLWETELLIFGNNIAYHKEAGK